MIRSKVCNHEWVVFATRDVCLLVACDECEMLGIVEKTSKEEWGFAPEESYRWFDNSRVSLFGYNQLGEKGGLLR